MDRLLYAITLNWNRCDDTLDCLASFEKVEWPVGWRIRLLLVDNASSDGSVAAVQTRFPQVEVLQNTSNVGFARGANRGLRHALAQGAEAIFLFNNDTLFVPGIGRELLPWLEPDIAAVAPAIFYAAAPTRIWSLGGGRNPLTLEMTGNHGRSASLPEGPQARAVLTGCALLFSAEALRALGLFDEQFFMYYEDSDWSLRAQRAGWQLRVVPSAQLWHKEAQSSGGLGSPQERYHMARASVIFFRKHARGLQWPAIVLMRLASALRVTLRLARHQRWAAVQSYWHGLWDGLRAPVQREGSNCAP